MTGALIFKMELFKFLRDRKYLLMIAILAVLNTAVTLFYTLLLTSSDHLDYDGILVRFASVMVVVTIILVLGNIIFMYLFPFHVLSIDYKNNVMAMMIASGVNRTKLFCSKVGAVLVLNFAVFLTIAIGPLLIIIFRTFIGGQLNDFFEGFVELFNILNIDFDAVAIFITGLLSVLSNVVIMTAATILMKGRNTAILVTIGFNMANSFVTSFFNVFAFSTSIGYESLPIIQGVSAIFSIAIFSFIGLWTLQRQNL